MTERNKLRVLALPAITFFHLNCLGQNTLGSLELSCNSFYMDSSYSLSLGRISVVKLSVLALDAGTGNKLILGLGEALDVEFES